MTLDNASKLASSLLAKYNCAGWSFAWSMNPELAWCDFNACRMEMNPAFAVVNCSDNCRDIFLHEIAHILVGFDHGHDEVWRSKARAIGSNQLTEVAEFDKKIV